MVSALLALTVDSLAHAGVPETPLVTRLSLLLDSPAVPCHVVFSIYLGTGNSVGLVAAGAVLKHSAYYTHFMGEGVEAQRS